ncbi:MAG: PilW family protein [Burkholderiaceae bacterium]
MRSQRGLSIVELLVGMAIGLLAALAIVQGFSASEIGRRATTGQADAQQVGTMTGWRLMRELRLAGNGFANGMNVWGCRLLAWQNGSALLPRASAWPQPFAALPTSLNLLPIAVLDGGGTNPDTVMVMSAGNSTGGAPMAVTITSQAQVETLPSVGFRAGDMLLVSNPSTSGGDCQIGQVDSSYTPPLTGQAAATAVPTSSALAAPYNNANGFTLLPQPADYTLMNIGATPTFALFGVSDDEQLVQLDMLERITLSEPAPIGENVVNLQVLYGIDDGSAGGVADDNIVDTWVTPTDAWSFANLQANGEAALAIKALRLAIVVRSTERQGVQGPASITLFPDLPATVQTTLNHSVEQRSFQYQVYDTVVPLPNQRIALCAEHRRYGGIPSAGACT